MTYLIFGLYFLILIAVGFVFKNRSQSTEGYILGGRNLNYWVTSLSAHASDMSAWLFMGFPAAVYMGGLGESWTAVGLIIFIFITWHFIAPAVRRRAEENNALTFAELFKGKDDQSRLRIAIALITVFYLICYVGAGFVGLGRLFEEIFRIDYHTGLFVSFGIIACYILLGGFLAVAWNDMLQAVFLFIVIILVPVVALQELPSISSLFTDLPTAQSGIFAPIFLTLSWGLGYFGMPHLMVKFMSIDDPKNLNKSKYLGVTWQAIVLIAAIFIGLIGLKMFPNLENPELVFVHIAKALFSPTITTLILCAMLAATISTLDAQIITASSTLSHDLKILHHKKESPWVVRGCVLFICTFAIMIAWSNNAGIYSMIHYAWTGLGGSFGPLVLFLAFGRRIHPQYACYALCSGFTISALWPCSTMLMDFIPAMIPAYITGLTLLTYGSYRAQKR